MKTRLNVILIVTALFISGISSRNTRAQEPGQIAPLLENLGTLHHKVTAKSERVQRFFDQGLRLVYAFNHNEAIRAFKEAARLDPACAMAYWGEALALGPNINDAMPPEREEQAYAVLQKALALKSKVSEKERAYIDALARRYSIAKGRDRAALDRAFSDAMAELARAYPDDADAATIYAASLMELSPWNYYLDPARPKPETIKAVSALESVIARFPDHPGAHHYYIHAVEASENPDRGIASADRLGALMPGAGHLVHMPAHIYIRVGRYSDAVESNIRAIAADEDYLAQCRVQGLYPLGYYPHNIHFLWAALTWEGRSVEAIRAASQVSSKMPEDALHGCGGSSEHFWITPLYALVRFGKWDEILREGTPPEKLIYPTGVWHYARGLAFTAKGQMKEAEDELKRLKAISKNKTLSDSKAWGLNTGAKILAIATEVLAGELAAKRGDFKKAIEHLKKGVALEDRMIYNEPPDWHYPVRHSLGAVLLDAGRAAEAEAVYREDLKKNRENGWSLFGLMQSLKTQGKTEEAAEAEKRFEKAWARADVNLVSSRF